MSQPIRFDVTGEASSGLLCRLLGLFAQLDLPAPVMSVKLDGERMLVEASLAHFGDALALVVAHKASRLIGVDAVFIDGTAV